MVHQPLCLQKYSHLYWIGDDVGLRLIDNKELFSGDTAYEPCPVQQLASQDAAKAIRNSENFA